MGKGKKGGSAGRSRNRALDAAPAPKFDPKQSRAKRLETAEDAFGGDEDAFHSNRDRVFFENHGERETGNDDDGLSDDDEVFGLNLPQSESDVAEEEEDVALDEEESEDDEPGLDTRKAAPLAPLGRFAKTPNPAQDVLHNSDSEADTADEADDKAENSEEEEDSWGANSYHVSRRQPGEPDSEDEEALELEAEEARRLQRKLRGNLVGEEDFGLVDQDEDAFAGAVGGKAVRAKRIEEEDDGQALGVQAGQSELSKEEAVALLLKHHPETLALLDDFADSAARLKEVERTVQAVRLERGEDGEQHPSLVILELEHQALATYLPTLAFYFSLLLSPTTPSQDLVDKVLARLSSLRTSLSTMEELDLTTAGLDDSDGSDDDAISFGSDDDEGEGLEMLASDAWDLGTPQGSDDESVDGLEDDEEDDDDSEGELDSETEGMLDGLDDDELEALMEGMDPNSSAEELMKRIEEYRMLKDGLGSGGESEEEDAAPSKATVGEKRKRGSSETKQEKAKKRKKGEVVIPTLPPLASSSSKKSKKSSAAPSGGNDDYLDPTSLTSADSLDKSSKRHSLRFHVSQVHQKQMKREAGGKNRVGGDEDLPRRSKERSRREVLKRQEHGAAKGQEGAELDGMEWGEEDLKTARGVKGSAASMDDGDDGEDYYDLVKQSKTDERAAKKAKYDGDRAANKAELDAYSEEMAAGPRGATRKILANKGLQPKRAKINRNPRVKKRMQYEGAKKKVASMKSIYKGGLGALGGAGYEGEKSGIGKKVVKSVRLG